MDLPWVRARALVQAVARDRSSQLRAHAAAVRASRLDDAQWRAWLTEVMNDA